MQAASLAGVIFLLAFFAGLLPAASEEIDVTAAERVLVVTLSLNGRQISDGALAYKLGPGKWALPAASLATFDVKADWETALFHEVSYWVLQEKPGVELHYDDTAVHLTLVLDPEHFSVSRLSAGVAKTDLMTGTVEVPAVFLEYEGGLLMSATSTSGVGAVGIGASGSWGVGVSQWTYSSATDRLVHRGTALTFDHPEDLSTIMLGDGMAPSFGGLLPVPFTGVSWYTNFELDPSLISFPLPAVTGTGMVPGSVEVRVDGRPAYNSRIGEGPFEIDDIRAPAGVSHVEIVTRDLLGNETRTLEPVYVEPLLLKPGLLAVAVSVGRERTDDEDGDFVYGRPFVRAALRRGITESFTLGGEVEASDRVVDANLTLDAVLAGLATLSMNGGASWASTAARTAELHTSAATLPEHADKAFGHAFSASASRRTGQLSIAGSVRYASGAYRQLGTTGSPTVERSYNLSASGRVLDGTLAASAAWYSVRDTPDYGVGTFSYTHDLFGFAKWTVGGSYIGGAKNGLEARFGIVVPLGDGRTGSSTVVRGYNRAYTTTASVVKSPPPDRGGGYYASMEYGEMLNVTANLDYRHRSIEGRLGLADRDGRQAVRARTRGGVVFTEGDIFTSRQIEDGMVLVETPGVKRAPVSVNNRDAGDTGTNGRTLVPVTPFVPFRVAVDETLLPIEMQLSRASAEGAVGRRRVAVVQFSSVTSHTLTGTVRYPDGAIPAAGTPLATKDGPTPLPVGYDGIVYLVSDDPVRAYTLPLPEGRCTFVVDFEAPQAAEAGDNALPVLQCL